MPKPQTDFPRARIIFYNLPVGPDGEPVPFGVAGLDVFEVDGVPSHVQRKANRLIADLGDFGRQFAMTMHEAEIIFPPNKVMKNLAEVLRRGLAGETVILTGAFCPDYTYRATGNPEIPFEYTFDGVGNGIGLVAQQFVRILPQVVQFLEKYGIDYRVRLGIGDFEANSQDILDRVGLTYDEFVGRCAQSLVAFRERLKEDVPSQKTELVLFEQEWAGDRWKKYVAEAQGALHQGDFGKIKEATGKNPQTEIIPFIAKASKSFYEKWYGRQMSEVEATSIVLDQGAEYAAMGRILGEDFAGQPVIQIAGDRSKMQALNTMYNKKLVTLCGKRVY